MHNRWRRHAHLVQRVFADQFVFGSGLNNEGVAVFCASLSQIFYAKPKALPRHRHRANALTRRREHRVRNRRQKMHEVGRVEHLAAKSIELIDDHFTVGKACYEFQLAAQCRDELAQGADVNVVLMLYF